VLKTVEGYVYKMGVPRAIRPAERAATDSPARCTQDERYNFLREDEERM